MDIQISIRIDFLKQGVKRGYSAMAKLFFSYSHKDEALRDELEIHLSMLKRQNIIETWHDRRIDAGKEFNREISDYLSDANIVLLLVSPYFLASDYCYDVELLKALEMHDSGEAVVIPVILHPSDWHSASFGKLTAVPKDGKPISKFPNQHEAFLDVTTEIRKVAEKFTKKKSNSLEQTSIHSNAQSYPSIGEWNKQPRSSNLRIKKEFTDQDIDIFVEESFEYISNFFEGSLKELQIRNPEIKTKFRKIDANHFTASIYRNGKSVSSCKIWLGNSFGSTNQISYSSSISSDDNSMNDSISVKSDGHTLTLEALANIYGADGTDMTQEGAAEYYWEQLIDTLQR